MKSDFQKALTEAVAKVPRAFLEKLIEGKIAEAGVEPTAEGIRRVVDGLIVGESKIHWDEALVPTSRSH
jgi:hypothetical protein